MKNVFLCSYFAKVEKLFKNFVEKDLNILLKNERVLFIPTASIVEEINFYVDEALNSFKNLEMSIDILELTKTNEEIIKEKLENTKFLYISGGNTFFLLQELKRKNLLSLIKNKIDEGMIYIGESGGAMIATQNIAYAEDIDDKTLAKDLVSTEALGIVDFYPIVHYDEEPFIEINKKREEKYKNILKIINLNNSQAILIKENSIKIETLEK